MDATVTDQEHAMTFLRALPGSYEHSIVAVDAATDNVKLMLKLVKSRLIGRAASYRTFQIT